MVSNHPISVGSPEHMLATYLQVSDLPSQSVHCEATWYPGIYGVLLKTWLQIAAHGPTLWSLEPHAD
jgi:hypothetical protein